MAITSFSSPHRPLPKTFSVISPSTTIGNNKSMLSLLNATASGVIIKLREIWLFNTQTTAVTGIASDFRFFRFTGHSGGTLLTAAAHDTADTIDGDVTVRTGATISGESASYLRRWVISSDDWGPGTLDTESQAQGAALSGKPIYDGNDLIKKPITFRPGEGGHLKHVVNSTAGAFDIIFVFTEEEE